MRAIPVDGKGRAFIDKRYNNQVLFQNKPIKKLTVEGAQNIHFKGNIHVKGVSDRPYAFSYLVNLKNSKNLRFDTLTIEGEQPVPHVRSHNRHHKNEARQQWNRLAPSGVVISSLKTHIQNLYLRRVHYGAAIKAKFTNINNFNIQHFSGDACSTQASFSTIRRMIGFNAIKTLPYDRIHRDFHQIFQSNRRERDGRGMPMVRDIVVNHSHYRNGRHPLSESPTGGIVGMDSRCSNLLLENVDIDISTPENGVGFTFLTNSRIEVNSIHDTTGKYNPAVALMSKKRHLGKSQNNRIYAPHHTKVLVDYGSNNQIIRLARRTGPLQRIRRWLSGAA